MDSDTKITVEATKYWGPIAWRLWNEANAMPDKLPESIWERHNGHEAAYQVSALGIHAFYCYKCHYSWSLEGQQALMNSGSRKKKIN